MHNSAETRTSVADNDHFPLFPCLQEVIVMLPVRPAPPLARLQIVLLEPLMNATTAAAAAEAT
jgi:hypothetical protein